MEGLVTAEGVPFAVIPVWAVRLQPLTDQEEISPKLPPGYLSRAPSADELVIRQRDLKRWPTTSSLNFKLTNFKRNSSFHSLEHIPPQTSGRSSPSELSVTLQSRALKRLLLDDAERTPLTRENVDFSDIRTPQKFKITSPMESEPPMKKPRLEKLTEFSAPIDVALKGLSPTQLINMIKNITETHPEIEDEVRKDMPTPDLAPLEERLNYLKSNIFRSLPTSRLTSKTDSSAYSQVATHLAAFKKCVVEQGQVLVESQHWESVIRYVFLAWGYVRTMPVWDNQPHNVQRQQCFKTLTSFCMTALKKGNLSQDYLIDVRNKLIGMVTDSDDIPTCLKLLTGIRFECLTR